jgi:predicted amidophosphoribosyltransferase
MAAETDDLAGFADPPISAGIGSLYHFLDRTLLHKRTVHERNGVGYVSIRAWRKSIKDTQIAALRSIKMVPSKEIAEQISTDFLMFVTALHGATAFDTVVPVPAGSSNMKNSLSVLVAHQLAGRLQIPFNDCLSIQGAIGTSHPRKSAALKPYLMDDCILGRVLLVDDVATTGTHIEMAVRGLRNKGAVPTAVVWIGQ